jgi:hypothetical protein
MFIFGWSLGCASVLTQTDIEYPIQEFHFDFLGCIEYWDIG